LTAAADRVKQFGDIMQRISDHHRIEQFLTNQTLSMVFAIFNRSGEPCTHFWSGFGGIQHHYFCSFDSGHGVVWCLGDVVYEIQTKIRLSKVCSFVAEQ
jgi:hypothetical protein